MGLIDLLEQPTELRKTCDLPDYQFSIKGCVPQEQPDEETHRRRCGERAWSPHALSKLLAVAKFPHSPT